MNTTSLSSLSEAINGWAYISQTLLLWVYVPPWWGPFTAYLTFGWWLPLPSILTVTSSDLYATAFGYWVICLGLWLTLWTIQKLAGFTYTVTNRTTLTHPRYRY